MPGGSIAFAKTPVQPEGSGSKKMTLDGLVVFFFFQFLQWEASTCIETPIWEFPSGSVA